MPNTKTPAANVRKPGTANKATGQGNSQLDKYFTDSLKDIYWAEK